MQIEMNTKSLKLGIDTGCENTPLPAGIHVIH